MLRGQLTPEMPTSATNDRSRWALSEQMHQLVSGANPSVPILLRMSTLVAVLVAALHAAKGELERLGSM